MLLFVIREYQILQILIYKGNDSENPKNYRPITCLSVILKLFTTIIKNKIELSMKSNPIQLQLSENQLGCKKYSYASKEPK